MADLLRDLPAGVRLLWSTPALAGLAGGLLAAVALSTVASLLAAGRDHPARSSSPDAVAVRLVAAIAALGIYGCVPDTEKALPLLGFTTGCALLGPIAGSVARFERVIAGGIGLVAIFVVDAGHGGRASATIGGMACIAIAAFVTAAWRPTDRGSGARSVAALLLVDVVTTGIASRVAGISSSTAFAAVVAGASVAVALTATAAALLSYRRATLGPGSERRSSALVAGNMEDETQ